MHHGVGPFRRGHRVGGGKVADRANDIRSGPGRPARRQQVHHLRHGHRPVDTGLPRRVPHSIEDRAGGVAEVVGFLMPSCHQIGDTDPRLTHPRIHRRLPGQRGPFPPRRITTLPHPELLDLHGERRVDLHRPLRQHRQQLGRDTGDVGLAVDYRFPRHPEPLPHPGTESGLVQATQHPLVVFQVAGIQRPPPPIHGLDFGGDDGVGVDLRIIRPRRRLPKRRHRQPARLREHPAPVHPYPGCRPEPLQMGERDPNRGIVDLEPGGVAGEGPQDAHRLRRRERRVEPGDRPHDLPIGPIPVGELRTER